ncbi:MAG: PLDc N-terminal domain-containing protein, partial [Nanoarchaeota archaeon]
GDTMGLWTTLFWMVGIVCAVLVILDIWTKQKKMKYEHKVLWTIAAVILNILTAIVYYFIVKRK